MAKPTKIEDVRFCKYPKGSAYYYWYRNSPKTRTIVHCLSMKKFEGADPNYLQSVRWEKIPETYRHDMVALNPKIRKLVGVPSPQWQEKPAANQFDLKDIINALKPVLKGKSIVLAKDIKNAIAELAKTKPE